MKKDWHPDELVRHWSLSPNEHDLLGESRAARLNFAILLKAFQLYGRFPERRGDIAASVIVFVSGQIGVPPEIYFEEDWSERTQRLQRAQVREHCGFHAFRAEDEAAFVEWLSERVVSPNPDAELLKIAAYEHLRAQRVSATVFVFPCARAAAADEAGRGPGSAIISRKGLTFPALAAR